MVDSMTPPVWMTRVALRISASSVLELLDHARPQSNAAMESTI
jgi:hypothetical protein